MIVPMLGVCFVSSGPALLNFSDLASEWAMDLPSSCSRVSIYLYGLLLLIR